MSAYSTKFVGRADDLTRIRELIASSERVVTIVGPPGIGKTRLSREVAGAETAAVFSALAETRDVEGICRAVAGGLGVSLAASGSAVAQVARILVDRRTPILVLDNVEQVLAATREVLATWADFAPDITFLVTSRERLGLPNEVVHELSRLGGSPRPSEPSEAVELLLDRVGRAGRTYQQSDADLSALSSIAERLEGLPLAMELVAPRIALLGARTVEARLRERGDLLAISTLRGTLEWSWALLTEVEQQALAKCSAFAGGFGGAAAEHVLGEQAFELLQGLRQKSLLIVSPPPVERFAFTFSVRDFAQEKLDALGLREETELAHARWCEAWAADSAEAAQPSAFQELALERDNLLAAANRSLAAADRCADPGREEHVQRALVCAVALHTLAWSTGPFDGYEPLLSAALASADRSELASDTVASALAARGQARRRLGRHDDARADLDRAIALAARLGDDRIGGRSLCWLGLLEIELRRLDDAQVALDRALDLARSAADQAGEAHALYSLGLLATERGDAEQGSLLFERAVRLLEETGAVGLRGYARMHLAAALLHRGLLDEAERAIDAATSDHHEVGNAWFAALAACSMGTIELVRERPERAMEFFDRGLPRLRAAGDDRSYGGYLGHRALALSALGRLADARREVVHAVDLLRGSGDVRTTGVVLGWLAGIEAENDDIAGAERSFAAAETLITGVDARAAASLLRGEQVLLDLARARAAQKSGAIDEAAAHVERARARLAEGRASGEGAFYYTTLSFDRARRALAAWSLAAAASPAAASLVVDVNGRWLIAHGERHSIARQVTLQRLLRRLVDARQATPGEPVSSEDLVSCGWPAEKVGHDAALNRLRVAITRLRQRGLEGALVGVRGGYLLDPDVSLELSKDS